MKVDANFGRLRKALMLEGEPDRVPLIEAGVDNQVKAAFLGRPVESLEDEMEFWATAGYDYVPIQAGIRTLFWPGHATAETGPRPVAKVSKAVQARYSLFTEQYTERAWAEEGRGLITSQAEFASFPWPTVEEMVDFSTFEEAARCLPPNMGIIAYMGYVYTATWWLMGFEAFCEALTQDLGLVERMFDKVGSLVFDSFQKVIALDGVKAVWHPDDMAYSEGLMVSPQVLRRYVFPWYRRMGEVCRQKGLPYIFHSDGRLDQVLEDIIGCGFNALHPIEPKAMNITHLKRTVGNRLCLCGNIDLAYTLTRGTPEEVEAEVRQRIRDCAPGGGYCVGSSNSVTEYVPLQNYNAMRKAVFQYGRYPLAL